MPEKPLDRRAKMTRELLKQSLIELMKDRPIHEISIKKICETADINRSTFYHHYDSQYELFNEILNDVSHEIAQIVAKHQTSIVWLEEILCEALTYVDVNKDTILVILGDNSGFSVGESFASLIDRFIDTSSEQSNEALKYCIQFAAAGMTTVVWNWLNAQNRMSAQELAHMMTVLLKPSIGRFTLFPLQ
ncbi:MAG: TetR/AcrR family transcriptional regulator [Acutalibacteraceae bacterium]|nr:TetR/AcrR family transcriptional regulator [Acutalibacteraceae bacterium]